MEFGRHNTSHQLRPEARERVISAWRDLGEPGVGAEVLRKIQKALQRANGGRAAISPATIARILADADAELLHPEVIQYDTEWRAREIERETRALEPFRALLTDQPMRLSEAEALIKKMDAVRSGPEDNHELRTLAIEGRHRALARAQS